jgi:putative ABC transport system substrate-binding protein
MRRLILGFALILLCAGILLLSDRKPAVSAIPQVAIFQFSSQKVLDDGVSGMVDALRDHGYIDGRTMHLERFNAQNDMPTANSIARELTSGRFGYVFTVSTNCLQAVAKANREGRVKHVFGVVASPVEAGVGISPTNPLDHPPGMVGIGSLMPLGELLDMALKLNPRLKRIGLPWNPSQSNSETYTRMARVAAKRLSLDLLEGSVDNTSAVAEVTSSLIARGAEAIVVTGDLTVSLGIDALIAAAARERIPVCSSLTMAVGRGALFAIGTDYYQIGRQTGDLAARVLGGEDPKRMPIVYSFPKKLVLDPSVVPRLKGNWSIPADVAAQAAKP